MSDLTQLYQDIILRHNKSPANYGAPENFSAKAEGNNPLCGDEVTVYWHMEDGRIGQIHFQAQGCAISRASASMMTLLLQGKTIEEAKTLFSQLKNYLLLPESGVPMEQALGDLAALSGVRKYPARIKCATLAWHAFLDNL